MNWSKRRRFVVRSFTGYRTMIAGNTRRKPTRTWHVFDRAYNFAPVSPWHRTRQAARDHAAALEEQHA